MSGLNKAKLARIHQRLSTDLEFYSRNALIIADKTGNAVPFHFNKAQRYIHERLEEQLAETGMVRAYIVKGRQQGCSTYVSARYYHKAAWIDNTNVYILSHEAKSTQTIFEKGEMFHAHTPEPLRPRLVTANRNELKFENGSKYAVGTAGARATGRSQTNKLFHGSEVAYYENAGDVQTGVLQTVADVEGTEIILESTANGVANDFYTGCMDALNGRGRYILIFVPWYWQDEYKAKVPEGFSFTAEELEIQQRFGLTNEQLYWRYLKVIELKSESRFKQEYPCTVQEAFQSSGVSLISNEAVQNARKSDVQDTTAPLIMGVDPAREGDRTVLTLRRGRQILWVRKYDKMQSMELAGIISAEIEKYSVDKVFIDAALGYGTCDRLKELGFGRIAQTVHFNARPSEEQYANKRAEMACALRDWLEEGNVNIPDREEIEVDLLSVPDFKRTSTGKIAIESKDKIKEVYGRSPDIFDSMMLTFAYPVRGNNADNLFRKATDRDRAKTNAKSPLKTMERRRARTKTQESKGNKIDIWAGQPLKTL